MPRFAMFMFAAAISSAFAAPCCYVAAADGAAAAAYALICFFHAVATLICRHEACYLRHAAAVADSPFRASRCHDAAPAITGARRCRHASDGLSYTRLRYMRRALLREPKRVAAVLRCYSIIGADSERARIYAR